MFFLALNSFSEAEPFLVCKTGVFFFAERFFASFPVPSSEKQIPGLKYVFHNSH